MYPTSIDLMGSKLKIGQNDVMKEKRQEERKPESQSSILPPHILKIAKESIKQYENGQTISLDEFKEKHFSKK